MTRSGLPFEPFESVKACYDELAQARMAVCGVVDDPRGTALGGLFVAYTRYAAFYLQGGSNENISLPGAIRLLHWEAIRRLMGEGVRQYDFVGARLSDVTGTKLESIQRFKGRFGSELVRGRLWKMDLRRGRTTFYESLNAIRCAWKMDFNQHLDIIDQENVNNESRHVKSRVVVRFVRCRSGLKSPFFGRGANCDHSRSMQAALVEWLLRAQAATPDGGVAESYSVLERRWAASYPETTGYIICSMLRAADFGLLDREQLSEAAVRMGEWLCDVQMESGAFQSGRIDRRTKKPAVFNTGQILKGLTDLMRVGLDHQGRFAQAARRAADWLMDNQDADGCWRRGQSILTTEPVQAYNVRTAWSLSRYGRFVGCMRSMRAGILNGEWLLSTQRADGWYPQMNFDIGVPPWTHTIAYTINGMFELGVLGQRSDFVESALRAARAVASRRDRSTGAVPGQFAEGFKSLGSWTSMTGNSQMAIIWFRAAQVTGGREWRLPAEQANGFNRRLQDFDHPNPGRLGALRGSYPGHVGYGRYWYMNWTQKFALDAFLAEMGVSIC